MEKKPIIEKYKRHPTDTGSPEVQVALLTSRINQLNEHFKKFPKDFSSRRGFLRLIGRRRQLLNYLRSIDYERYKQLVEKLALRK